MRKISFSNFTLIPAERRLLCADREVDLNPKAFDLLTILAENPGQVISKEEIMERVWPDSAVEEGNLAVQISNLRSAMRFFSDDTVIRTVPGIGYCFAVDISESEQDAGDMRCDHRGRCIGMVITGPVPADGDRTIDTFVMCLENVASELDDIHLYSRKPHRGVQRANGGAFVETRIRRLESQGKPAVAVEFINPTTEEVRYRSLFNERDIKTLELGMAASRRLLQEFTTKVVSGWKRHDEPREKSARNFLDNMLTQISFLIGMETKWSLEQAVALADTAIEQNPFDHRAFLLKLDALVRSVVLSKEKPENGDETWEVLLQAAARSGASADALRLARARIVGLVRGDWKAALSDLEALDASHFSSEELHLLRADLLSSAGRKYEAKLSLQLSLELNPLGFAAMRRLVRLNMENADREDACRIARSLLRFIPSDDECLAVLENVGAMEAELGDTRVPVSDSVIELNSQRKPTGGGKGVIPKRDHLLAVAIMKEATGDAIGGSTYRRMADLVGTEEQQTRENQKARGSGTSRKRRTRTSGDRSTD